MSAYAYFNGSFGKKEDISLPLTDRSIYFGDGVYEVAIGRGGRTFQKDEHISRLITNAKHLAINHGYNHDSLSTLLDEVVKMTGFDNFLLYFQFSRNHPHRTHTAKDCKSSNILITVEEFTLPYPAQNLRLISYPDMRYFYCHIKTLNLLPAVMAATEADKAGCDEAVLHRGETVTECAHSNISILKNGCLYTHPTTNLILPGITRRHLLLAADKLGIAYCERAFSMTELYAADEILITSTTKLCRRADMLDGVKLGMKDESCAKALCDALYNEYRQT